MSAIGELDALPALFTNPLFTDILYSSKYFLISTAKIWDIYEMLLKVKAETRHVFVKHGCPRRQQSQNMAKIYKSYILTLPHPQGRVMSVKCEEPIDELTVQVWLLYHHPNFKYCTL